MIIYTILIIGGLIFGWQYLPQTTRDKTTAFVGNVLRGQSLESAEAEGKEALPADPKEKRAVLIDRLKNNLGELKNAVSAPAAKNLSSGQKQVKSELPQVRDNAETLTLLEQSDQLLKKLEEANSGTTFSQDILNKPLDAILPEKKPAALECPQP